MRDSKILGFIAKVAANLYRDDQLNLMGVEIKVRRLIDEYIAAQGIDPRIPPIEITDVGFDEHVNRAGSSRARASEMQHAARHHIRIHMNEDPQFFRSMSEKLEDILQTLRDNWDELERVLRQFVRDVVERGRLESVEGLDPRTQAPFFGILNRPRLFGGYCDKLSIDIQPHFATVVRCRHVVPVARRVSVIGSQVRNAFLASTDQAETELRLPITQQPTPLVFAVVLDETNDSTPFAR